MQDREPSNPEGIDSASAANSPGMSPGGAEEAPAADDVAADLAAQLNDALAEAARLKEALLRAVADSDNLRKRGRQEVVNAHKFGLETFAGELLLVKDSLEAALVVDNATIDSYRSGVELTLKQLVNVFSKFNITEINPVGEKFDPHRQQAIAMVDAPQDANTVVTVVQKGYALNERILRPAMVTVAKPPAS